MAAKPSSNAVGTIFVALFSLPFIGMGGAFALKAYRSMQDPQFGNPWVGMLLGSFFVLIGVMLNVGNFYGGRLLKAKQARKEAFPQQPWMWRDDWAQGRADSMGRNSGRAAWVAAIIWNAIAWTIGYGTWFQSGTRTPVGADIMLGLFCVSGLTVLIFAVRKSLRQLRFGDTCVALQTVPAPLGGDLRGFIDVPLPSPLSHGVNLALTCVARVTSGGGQSRGTTEQILWQQKTNLGPEQMTAGVTGSRIPIAFSIPRDKPATDHTDRCNQILWLLRAQADVPGVDFDERYEVPIFETAQSPAIAQWQARQEAAERQHPASMPLRPTVEATTEPDGSTQFYFPPGTNTRVALPLSLVFGLFWLITYYLWHTHGPLFFRLMFSLFTGVLLLFTLKLWFGSARLRVNAAEVVLSTSTLGVGQTKRWRAEEISNISPKITMQSGGSNGVPYYTVTIALSSGRQASLGNALSDHNEAEWICEQMRAILKLRARTAATR